MALKTSYGQILSISLPIMLGSAAQNIIVLCDNFFLLRNDALDFAAMGLVGAFYLIIASVGYGFSRGGQILIARRFAEKNHLGVGYYFQSLVLFELMLAVIIFLGIQLGGASFFKLYIQNQDIYERILDYLYPRSYGVFFSYVGVAIIALYTGIARTRFIIWDTVLLVVTNIILDYILIFGAFGIEPMGIAGAAWASTIAEIVAFVVFVIYMIFDRNIRIFRLMAFSKLSGQIFRQCFSISMPIVGQSILGIGAYFVFFVFIENTSPRNLEISNMIRNLYLVLSIPTWGYSAGINTIVSNFIGKNKRQAVVPLIKKTIGVNLLTTIMISLPIVLFPEFFLLPLFGEAHRYLIIESEGLLIMLLAILIIFSIGSIYMNGLMGTGHTKTALNFQFLFTMVYLIYCYLVFKVFLLDLYWAWASELVYWGGILLCSIAYMNSEKWYIRKF